MILRELFYQEPENKYDWDENLYEPRSDDSPLAAGDTRKTRLTLGQINRIRKSTDFHLKQKNDELDFIKKMYSNPLEAEAGGFM